MSQPGSKDEPRQLAEICATEMLGPCGRPVHPSPEYDETPVCILHSNDPAKGREEFRKEFERTLTEAELTKSTADFANVVFPECDFRGMKFKVNCSFFESRFTAQADFAYASFASGVDFYESKFAKQADFSHTRFLHTAVFMRTEFLEGVTFELASFANEAVFMSATLRGDANFNQANFEGEARFGGARFRANALFERAKFCRGTEFNGARFAHLASFRHAVFEDSLDFRETHFRHDQADTPGLEFTGVRIERPERTKFYRTDLGQALFYNTDVSRVNFALVEWRDRGRGKSCLLRKRALRARLFLKFWAKPEPRQMRAALARTKVPSHPARLCLFEEEVHVFGKYALDLFRGPDGRNLGLIAEMYQEMKRNYDAKGDYWTAGNWHYGEMEMKRLHSRWRSRPARWLSHHLSLVALYKYASAYGESYIMPLLWLVFFVAAFAFLYPIPGLEFNPPAGAAPGWLGYLDWIRFFRGHPAEHPSGFWGMILHSLMTSLSVAGFQRELRYAPSYPWGRMLALLELLLTTTLGGLFLLAIRRQFKRS